MARTLSRRSVAAYIADELVTKSDARAVYRQLAAYLVDTRRTKEVDLFVRDIVHELSLRGHVAGTVTSAHELSQATKQALEAYTKAATDARAVHLDEIVDPQVLGGVKLSLPGKELDTTVAHQLLTLRTRYKKV